MSERNTTVGRIEFGPSVPQRLTRANPRQMGLTIVFGVVPVRPIVGLPHGKVRVRLRNNDFARVFVRNGYGTRQFVIGVNEEGMWYPAAEQGRNVRPDAMGRSEA